MLRHRLFVLGGAASGKSEWAEKITLNSGLRATYVATGRIFDDEVHERVKVHKARRDDRWSTIETPTDLAPALDPLGPDDIALIDCATMWLSNHMLDGSDLSAAQTDLLDTLRRCNASWVIVSNEVGHGIVPDNALARRFREAQGRLNIALAAEASVAVHVIAGLPQILKGTLP